jgi:hypothetical protein
MSTIIANAARATEAVEELVTRAIIGLETPEAVINGFGVFSDPAGQVTAVRAARERLDTALGVLTSTQWPTPADYDAAGEGVSCDARNSWAPRP